MTPANEADRIDTTLRALADAQLSVPPLSAELESELRSLAPRKPRSRLGGYIAMAALSLAYGATLLWYVGLRPDLGGLPGLWLIAYAAAWIAGFLGLAWLALVPPRGQVMPSWRHAGITAAVAVLGFMLAGLVFPRHATESVLLEPTLHNLVQGGEHCMLRGIMAAMVPVVMGALLLRGRVPVGSRWAGAALGAAGGSLSGLILHFYCPVADALHLGLVHGGVVLASAAVAALLVPPTVGR